MKSFFDNLFGKKQVPPKIQKRDDPAPQNEPQHEADDFYRKGDLIRGEYEVCGTLGKGGFGHVYLVRHCKLGVVYALKTIRDEFLGDSKARDAFKKEALLWVNLENHPFILSATLVLEISGRLLVFMEYIAPDAQGCVNLADHLVQTVGPLDTRQTLKWAIQFCLGMEHAGAHGIQCHRDIKPANILITQDGTLQIGDFGLSRAAEAACRQSHSQNGSLVMGSAENGFSFSLMQSAGKFRSGTPGYIAPEVYRFEGADIRSDIYSFGLVLWQMVAGSRVPPFMVPWRGDMENFLQGIYEKQMTGHAPRMKGPLVLAIDRCLQPNPSERFGSFRELRKVLEPIFEEATGRKFEKPQLGKQTFLFWNNKGISFGVLKQYEEALDWASSFEETLNPFDFRKSRALSLFNSAQRFVINYVWDVPVPKYQGIKGKILDDWQISGITQFQSGFPIRLQTQNDAEEIGSLFFLGTGAPQMTGSVPHLLNPKAPGHFYLDPTQFNDPALGTFATTPRSICCGPGENQWDLTFSKKVLISEARYFQFRTDIFNLFNKTQFVNPDGNFSSSTFGQVLSAREPRLVQVALKFYF